MAERRRVPLFAGPSRFQSSILHSQWSYRDPPVRLASVTARQQQQQATLDKWRTRRQELESQQQPPSPSEHQRSMQPTGDAPTASEFLSRQIARLDRRIQALDARLGKVVTRPARMYQPDRPRQASKERTSGHPRPRRQCSQEFIPDWRRSVRRARSTSSVLPAFCRYLLKSAGHIFYELITLLWTLVDIPIGCRPPI